MRLVDAQHQIKRILNADGALERVETLIRADAELHRTGLARRVCEEFGFFDARGRAQIGGCLAALRALEHAGRVRLPRARTGGGSCARRGPAPAVAPPSGVPDSAGRVRELSVVVVEDAAQRELWHALMAAEHPRGAGPLVGCQVRYLVGSAHGWLGAAGVAASALQLAARDRWIGWSAAQRRAHLHRVVGLSRFLIRPGFECRNLASHVLGRLLRRLPADFERRYGYAPYLVETFVDAAHSGASLRAANWRLLGNTAGRGRQDRANAAALGCKRVYVYELAPEWRRRLGVGAGAALASDPLAPGEGLETGAWAHNEFAGAPLGDARLSARLVETAALMGENPMASLPAAAKGDRAKIKGYYRFVDQPDEAAATPANILRPHRERTLRRMRAEPTVLCIQDGTDLNFATRPGCEGLGVIGTNQTGAQTLGLHLHSTLAVTPGGLPLGVLNAQFVAPQPKAAERGEGHNKTPQERKSARWIEGFRDCAELARELGPGRVVCVMDREADDFRLFEEQRARPQADLLVRVKGRRRVAGGHSLFDALRAAPVRARAVVAIDRLTTRPKSSKRPARPGRARRCATLALHADTVELAPTSREHRAKEPMRLHGVLVEEERTPAGAAPIRWLLLTTLAVDTPDECRRIVEYYARRWRIEDWHRILKSGCKVEELANRTATRLARAAAVNVVVAWRLFLLTLLGRDQPELAPEVVFSELEIQVLRAFAAEHRIGSPDTLAAAVLVLARIGGHIHRPRGPPPGTKVMWRATATLAGMCIGYRLAMEQQQ